jgi:prepilin-type processing-associated H-X9-DG protein/prepilin-type N-terminal cleavage/methylation domain-containing protein
MRRNASGGFTLIELLVVIGIIALLIALLMPALSGARTQALTVRCQANLHDIGRAMQNYANDYGGRVPRGYYYFPYYQQGYILWGEALSRYVGHPIEVADTSPARDAVLAQEFRQIPVYQCPAFPVEESALDYVSSSWVTGTDDSPLLQVTRVRRASEIVYLTEANANREPEQFWEHDVWQPNQLPLDANGAKQMTARVLNDERHRGQVNILYFDGHAGTKHYRELTVRDFEYGAPEVNAAGSP